MFLRLDLGRHLLGGPCTHQSGVGNHACHINGGTLCGSLQLLTETLFLYWLFAEALVDVFVEPNIAVLGWSLDLYLSHTLLCLERVDWLTCPCGCHGSTLEWVFVVNREGMLGGIAHFRFEILLVVLKGVIKSSVTIFFFFRIPEGACLLTSYLYDLDFLARGLLIEIVIVRVNVKVNLLLRICWLLRTNSLPKMALLCEALCVVYFEVLVVKVAS